MQGGPDLVLEHRLGEGGGATVYAARWRGREISAKVARDPDGAADLAAEAQLLARITHPALLSPLGTGELPDGRACLLLPRLRGEDLAARLARGPLNVDAALDVVTSIAGALTALHDAGVAHRDLKPENVFLADTGSFLLDLGIARALAGTASLRIRGTHDVMAPERLYGEPACVATEVYELAALAWAALAGQLPWPAGAAPSARRWIDPLPVDGARGAALDEVLRGALSTIPERRPASAAALAEALRAAAWIAMPASSARRTAEVAPRPALPTLPAPGALIADSYRLLHVLGSGGAGTVFAAEHLRLPRTLAIKILSPDRDDPDARSRFRREAEIVASLSHPHVVEVFDYDVDDRGAPFMVMARLDGETLRDRLRRGPLPAADVVTLIRQAASAVAAAHARGVVHRDLKPSNLFLRGADTIDVAVLDFGISKVLGASERTETGVMLGSPGYAAPEQIRGDAARIGPATDVFALAAIAYEALSGRRAFDGDNREAVLHQLLHGEPPPIAVPRAIDRVLRIALAKRAERRHASTEAFADALAAAAAETPPPASRRPFALGAALIVIAVPLLVAAVHNAPANRSIAPSASAVPALSLPVAAPAPSSVAPAAANATPADVHIVRVTRQPASARVELDGRRVTGDRITLAPGRHRLRITAHGYVSQDRVIDSLTIGDALELQLTPRAVHPTAKPEPELRTLLEK